MNCDFHRNRMADCITGRLTEGEAARLEEHLEECPDCRAYRQDLIELYQLDLCEEVPPIPLQKARFRQLERQRRRRRAGGLLLASLAVISGLVLLCTPWAGRGEPVTLAPLVLEMPDYPRHYPTREALANQKKAARLSAYTGKAILTTYYFPPCPRCVAMKKAFYSPEGRRVFSPFITVEENYFGKEPHAELEKYKTKYRKIFMLPAVVLTRGDQISEPLFAISKLADLESFIETWRTRWDDGLKPLPRPLFARCVELLDHLPHQLARADFGAALLGLEEVTGLKGTFRSRFIADAEQIRDDLADRLRRRVDRLIAGSSHDRARARLLVQRLGDTELGRELADLLAR